MERQKMECWNACHFIPESALPLEAQDKFLIVFSVRRILDSPVGVYKDATYHNKRHCHQVFGLWSSDNAKAQVTETHFISISRGY